jgi:glycerol uptake facilitator-like aquaporin
VPSLARGAGAEFVGTFFLVFFGVGAIASDAATGSLGHLGVSLALGVVVGTMVYAVGPRSPSKR